MTDDQVVVDSSLAGRCCVQCRVGAGSFETLFPAEMTEGCVTSLQWCRMMSRINEMCTVFGMCCKILQHRVLSRISDGHWWRRLRRRVWRQCWRRRRRKRRRVEERSHRKWNRRKRHGCEMPYVERSPHEFPVSAQYGSRLRGIPHTLADKARWWLVVCLGLIPDKHL